MEVPVPAKILIVDDEERNRKLLEVFAKADGYLMISTEDGKEGIALAVSELPNLILLDLMMPGTDGFEVARWLKNNPATRDIPIIIVSALDDLGSRQRMLASGADEFIGKPVNRWELSLRMSKLLSERPSSAAPPILVVDNSGR